MNQMKILHFSLFCRPGEFGHNEKSKRKMKTDQAIFFQACLLWEQRFIRWLTGSSSFIQRFGGHQEIDAGQMTEIYLRPPSELRPSWLCNQRFDLSFDRVWTTRTLASQQQHRMRMCGDTHTHIHNTPTHKHTDKRKHAWSNLARSLSEHWSILNHRSSQSYQCESTDTVNVFHLMSTWNQNRHR